MIKSKRLIAKATFIAALSMGAMILVCCAIYFSEPGKHWLQARSQALVTEGDNLANHQPEQAIRKFKAATLINRENTTAYSKLARLHLRLNQPDMALEAINRHANHQSSSDLMLHKSMAQLELNQTAAAVSSARQASAADPTAPVTLHLGLLYALTGSTDDLSSLMTRLGTQEPAGALKRASTHKLALAQELYALGLLRSSERILEQHLSGSESYYLLAKVKLSLSNGSDKGRQSVRKVVDDGLKLDPGNLKLRILSRQVYQEIGDQSAADREGELIKRLQLGQI
jgi:tetratricopeptide (TPR) repeat protein